MPDPQTATTTAWNWFPVITTTVGAVTGFFAAAVLEVWKTNRTSHKRAEALERALYAEMANLYRTLYGLDLKEAVEQKLILHTITTDSYKYAKQNPDLFHTLKHAFRIEAIYGHLQQSSVFTLSDIQFAEDEPIAPEYKEMFRITFIEAFTKELELAIRLNDLNIKLFRKASPSALEEIMENIEEDKKKYPNRKPELSAPGRRKRLL